MTYTTIEETLMPISMDEDDAPEEEKEEDLGLEGDEDPDKEPKEEDEEKDLGLEPDDEEESEE